MSLADKLLERAAKGLYGKIPDGFDKLVEGLRRAVDADLGGDLNTEAHDALDEIMKAKEPVVDLAGRLAMRIAPSLFGEQIAKRIPWEAKSSVDDILDQQAGSTSAVLEDGTKKWESMEQLEELGKTLLKQLPKLAPLLLL